MSDAQAWLAEGLKAFGACLDAEYGLSLAHWDTLEEWSERDKLQISRALGILMKEPIAEASAADPQTNDTGAKRRWDYSDARIAACEWEDSWQWSLLAEIDNGAKADGDSGQMMTPSDPRLYLLFVRYERDCFSVLAEHVQRFICDRKAFKTLPDASSASPAEIAVHTAALFCKQPGLDTASPALIAGLVFLVTKIGWKDFCDWCDERMSATSDDKL
jgi:hypothetical protein